MRLYRPYIPWPVREEVVDRQWRDELKEDPPDYGDRSAERRVTAKLHELFMGEAVELNHDPALCNRPWNKKAGDYEPPANDPNFMFYMLVNAHDIRTRVRGPHGQHSDLGLLRKRKRKAQKATAVKRRWPSRKLKSRGFDRTRTRGVDGRVRLRRERDVNVR